MAYAGKGGVIINGNQGGVGSREGVAIYNSVFCRGQYIQRRSTDCSKMAYSGKGGLITFLHSAG